MYSPYGLAGLALAIGAAVCVGFAVWVRVGGARIAAPLAAGALTFQVVHVFEHGIQVLFWAGDPSGRPWLSSWAAGTADGVGYWCSLLAPGDERAALGPELLHLLGNVIFFAGIVAMVALPHLASPRHVRSALRVQALHVTEHIVLTGTLLATGTAHGLSTVLDDVTPLNPTTSRVLFHFGINAVATFYAVAAVRGAGWRPWAREIAATISPSENDPTDQRAEAVVGV